jgi:hypothetical protein
MWRPLSEDETEAVLRSGSPYGSPLIEVDLPPG